MINKLEKCFGWDEFCKKSPCGSIGVDSCPLNTRVEKFSVECPRCGVIHLVVNCLEEFCPQCKFEAEKQ
jgi:hypothetical protein